MEVYKIFHELFMLIYHFQIIIWALAVVKIGLILAKGLQVLAIMATNTTMFQQDDAPISDPEIYKHNLL